MNDNIIIAEFMGVYSKENGYDYIKTGNKGVCYHTSWDWLMPVVEKIEGLRDKNGNAYRFTIDMCNAQIEETNIEILGGAFKIDTTYKAVVEFIKMHNN
jgi:hypothetical protein